MGSTVTLKKPRSLTRYAWLSIAAAVVTIGLKYLAYRLTGSVGLLSDALESLVNLVAAVMALVILTIAERPPDEEHSYGHTKAEYFSSGIEGGLILLAAYSIIVTAIPRLLNPQPIEQIGLGLALSLAASVVNFAVARVLLRAGRQYESPTLEADARHLLTDVWTSIGVLVGIASVAVTGLEWIDPVVALLVALNILWSGYRLLRRSVLGLMDTALSPAELTAIKQTLDKHCIDGVEYHALRTRRAAQRRFISVHILVPGDWTVQRGHQFVESIEEALRQRLPYSTVFTHLEPVEDPLSFADIKLDRSTGET